MYIKELELENFKNFSEKKIIDFYKGLNVIAGFGGTGKTNILDSINFVFGQKDLRILNNFDIFNKKSNSNLSKVKITLDNDDTIKRVLKKCSEKTTRSFYFINEKPVNKEQIKQYFKTLKLTVIDSCGENLEVNEIRKLAFDLKLKSRNNQIIIVSNRSPFLDIANHIIDVSNILMNLRFLRLKYPKYL